MVTTQGLERQESKEPSPVKGEGAVYRKPASRSGGGGAVSKESTPLRRHRGAKQAGQQGGGAVLKESIAQGGQEWCVRGLAPETQCHRP